MLQNFDFLRRFRESGVVSVLQSFENLKLVYCNLFLLLFMTIMNQVNFVFSY